MGTETHCFGEGLCLWVSHKKRQAMDDIKSIETAKDLLSYVDGRMVANY